MRDRKRWSGGTTGRMLRFKPPGLMDTGKPPPTHKQHHLPFTLPEIDSSNGADTHKQSNASTSCPTASVFEFRHKTEGGLGQGRG